MRYADIINEDVLKKDLILYHGTKSEPFDTFTPSKATKGETFWNPLGDGMYATDAPRFASEFGSNVHEVHIPAGATYKRITPRQWSQGVGQTIAQRAIAQAFKACGQNFKDWENGTKPDNKIATGKMSDAEILETCIRIGFPTASEEEKEKVRERGRTFTRQTLIMNLKSIISRQPRDKDQDKTRAIWEWNFEKRGLLARLSPYESLYEMGALARMIFGDKIGEAFEDALPKVSNAAFKRYDFVIFTDTNDVIGHGKNGASALEVVIFNPAYQRTRAMTRRA